MQLVELYFAQNRNSNPNHLCRLFFFQATKQNPFLLFILSVKRIKPQNPSIYFSYSLHDASCPVKNPKHKPSPLLELSHLRPSCWSYACGAARKLPHRSLLLLLLVLLMFVVVLLWWFVVVMVVVKLLLLLLCCSRCCWVSVVVVNVVWLELIYLKISVEVIKLVSFYLRDLV